VSLENTENSSLAKKLSQSWKSNESIFEVLKEKEYTAVGFQLGELRVPIFACLSDIYYTVKDGDSQTGLMMLDLLGSWLQSSTTQEAIERFQDFHVKLSTSDMDKTLERLLNAEH
jgi:hypothetical protein